MAWIFLNMDWTCQGKPEKPQPSGKKNNVLGFYPCQKFTIKLVGANHPHLIAHSHHFSCSPDTLPKTSSSHLSPQKEAHLLTPVFQVLYLSTSLHFWGSKKQTSNQAVGEKIYSSSTATLGFSEWFTMVGKSVWRVSGSEKKNRTVPPNANPHPPRNKAIRRWWWLIVPQ